MLSTAKRPAAAWQLKYSVTNPFRPSDKEGQPTTGKSDTAVAALIKIVALWQSDPTSATR